MSSARRSSPGSRPRLISASPSQPIWRTWCCSSPRRSRGSSPGRSSALTAESRSRECGTETMMLTTTRSPLTDSYWAAEVSHDVLNLSLGDLLRRAAATVPDRIGLVDAVEDVVARRSWTYAEFLTDAERAARALLARFGPGDRVAIWAPNSANWVILQQAISLAGMVLVPVNPAYRARELEYVLRQSGAAGLLHADSYRGFDMTTIVDELRLKLPDLKETIAISDWAAFLDSGDPNRELPAVAPLNPLQIQYTSGTTGFPRGALLHHKGLINAAKQVAERAGMPDGGVNINAMPMYHIGGGAVTSFGTLAYRA